LLKSLLDGIGAAVGAAACSVLPSFIQQYVSALSACQSELSRLAADAGSRAQAMSPDYLASVQARASWCGDAAQTLDGRLGVARVIAFFQNFDADLAHSTLRVFQPGVQLSLEGLYFFVGGLLLGLIVINILVFPFRIWGRRRRERAYYR
jgi:Protein of unknown function (DUF2937)